MGLMQQVRDADLSLLQSAVDEVVAKKSEDGAQRPDPDHPAVQAAATEAVLHAAVNAGQAPAMQGKGGAVSYCATLARNYGCAKLQGRDDDAAKYKALLDERFGVCDPHWAEAAEKYAEFLASRQQIPYRQYTDINQYVDNRLSETARIALVGDWGTGQPQAIELLRQIAAKKPDVVIHLGDIYYSATDFECQTYFYDIWSKYLDLNKVATFTLAGNHDMFSGGAPYYRLIDRLGQPASYFCLRNSKWQVIAIDTGLHDCDPLGKDPTYLENSEVAWLRHKLYDTAGGRRTILLSHHQLFSAFESIGGQAVNPKLQQQLGPMLDKVDMWFWGHEHNLVVYQKYLNVLARCIGHGAFPVGAGEVPTKPVNDIPVENVRLAGDPFLNHGYVMVELKDASADIAYYDDTNEVDPMWTERLEAPAVTGLATGAGS